MTGSEQVSPEAYGRSLPVPRAFAVTFGIDQWYWANQENGQHSGPPWAPSQDDVCELLNRPEVQS